MILSMIRADGYGSGRRPVRSAIERADPLPCSACHLPSSELSNDRATSACHQNADKWPGRNVEPSCSKICPRKTTALHPSPDHASLDLSVIDVERELLSRVQLTAGFTTVPSALNDTVRPSRSREAG
jgi:hypothetical protein